MISRIAKKLFINTDLCIILRETEGEISSHRREGVMIVYKTDTEKGSIALDRNVIARIVYDQLHTYHGKILLSNKKGKKMNLVKKMGGMDERDYMDISWGKDGLQIHLNVIIRFGTSISRITRQLEEEIRKALKETLELEQVRVTVSVTGMILSHTVRRSGPEK